MLVRNMLLDKRCSFEELLARFAPEPPFIFLLDVLLNCFAQLTATGMTFLVICNQRKHSLIVTLATIFTRVQGVAVNQKCNFAVKPLQPALI